MAAAATGVYVGCVWQEYLLLLEQLAVPPSVSVLTGSGLNFLIGRVSYTFGFQGAHSHRQPNGASCSMVAHAMQQQGAAFALRGIPVGCTRQDSSKPSACEDCQQQLIRSQE